MPYNSTGLRATVPATAAAPLLLLGNDFLQQRKAILALNIDGKGAGTISLQSEIVGSKQVLNHSFSVSGQSQARPSPVALVDAP